MSNVTAQDNIKAIQLDRLLIEYDKLWRSCTSKERWERLTPQLSELEEKISALEQETEQ